MGSKNVNEALVNLPGGVELSFAQAVFLGCALCVAVPLFQARRGVPAAGALAAWSIALFALHLLSPLTRLLPWNASVDPYVDSLGLEVCLWAQLGMLAGTVLARRVDWIAVTGNKLLADAGDLTAFFRRAAVVGIGAQLLFIVGAGRIPGGAAVLSSLGGLVAASILGTIWLGRREKRIRMVSGALAVLLAIPLFTMVFQGFLGFGAVPVLLVLMGLWSLGRKRAATLATGIAAVGYVGLSFYVSYMIHRNDLRRAVWGGDPVSERMDRVLEIISSMEPLDLKDPRHLSAINLRLDQGYLVGMAAAALDSGARSYWWGKSLWDAAVAMAPRALWPDKPATGGSGKIVSEFTGLEFAQGTSVGVGQVLEAFINFGRPGVFISFAVLAVTISLLDRRAALALSRGDAYGFLSSYVYVLPLLNIGGSLTETSASIAAAFVALWVFRRLAGGTMSEKTAARHNPPAAGSREIGEINV